MTRASDRTLTTTARTIALEAAVNAGRLAAALHNMADAEGFLTAARTDTSHTPGTVSDPTGRLAELAAVDHPAARDEATADRDRLERCLARQLRLSAQIAAICATWNPDEATQARIRGNLTTATDVDIWCTNHARHGMNEPKSPGRTLCDFCQDYRQRPDNPRRRLPGRWILDVASRRRINSADVTNDLRLQDEATSTTTRKRQEPTPADTPRA